MLLCDEYADVLIVGSGPVGATFARLLTEQLPLCKVILLDGGPLLTRRAGMHINNMLSLDERIKAQIASQWPLSQRSTPDSSTGPLHRRYLTSSRKRSVKPPPGTFLLDPNSDKFSSSGMPAAAMSSNVGGMGSHWTCACPRFGEAELPPFISNSEWDRLYGIAERLLKVTSTSIYQASSEELIFARLKEVFDRNGVLQRPIGSMPLACELKKDGGRVWSGVDTVLGPLALPETASLNFELRANTICLQLVTNDNGVEYAIVKHRLTQQLRKIRARIFVIAADALRTPQLLWKSGFRTMAMGRYLNDQPQSVCSIRIKANLVTDSADIMRRNYGPNLSALDDSLLGIYWVPFSIPDHPFHGQVVRLGCSPIEQRPGGQPEHGPFATFVWFCRKQIQYEDYLEFAESEYDTYGMPQIKIHYQLTAKDREVILHSKEVMRNAAVALGSFLEEAYPWTLPAGSSLHYQGTTRMGNMDDGRSVCNSYCQLWGTSNLFVGGNGVIPTATASNPTLSSVALAIRACTKIVSILS
jgi:hypothetical protein